MGVQHVCTVDYRGMRRLPETVRETCRPGQTLQIKRADSEFVGECVQVPDNAVLYPTHRRFPGGGSSHDTMKTILPLIKWGTIVMPPNPGP